MRKFGIKLDGQEQIIEDIIVNYLKESNYQEFKYLEIGAAGSVTMKAIYEIISENIKHQNWSIWGLDLPNGYSLDWNQINKFGYPLKVIKNNIHVFNTPEKANATLWLQDNPRELINSLDNESIDICFIDADHSYKAVQADFLVVEPKIKKNGIITAHDTDVLSQGTDFQELSQDFIGARRAFSDLGLYDNKKTDWQFLFETQGFNGGNGCSFFRKIS